MTVAYDPLIARWRAWKRMRDTVITALEPAPGLRMLELGCGSGRLALALKRHCPEASIRAVDANAQILKVARRKAARAGLEVVFAESDIAGCLADDRYDRIYSTLVLHHLTPSAKERALANARDLLKPDGLFVLADFGRPRGRLERLVSRRSAILDPLETTGSHRDGRLEAMLLEKFPRCHSIARIRTMFGPVEVWACQPSDAPSTEPVVAPAP